MEDWLKIIAQRLQNAKTPLPSDSWDRFEAMLPSGRRHLWPWFVGAGIVMAASVALFVFLKPQEPVVTPFDNSSTVASDAIVLESSDPVLKQISSTEKRVLRSKSLAVQEEMVAKDEVLSDIAVDAVVSSEDQYPISTPIENKEGKDEIDKTESSVFPYDWPKEEMRSRKRIEIAAHFHGWVGSVSTIHWDGEMPVLSGSPARTVYPSTVIASNHMIPLSFGVHFSYPILSKWALTSGVDITCYYSEITMAGYSERLAQRAYYLGVPIKMDVQIWREGRFSLWLGAGAQVNRCLYATLDGKRLMDRSWLWSAMVDCGIQYKVSKHLDLFVEPEVSYAFDSLTPGLLTYRTEHPLMFTVGAGLRFGF